MANIYTIEYNGKRYKIEGDSPPTEQDMQSLAGEQYPQTEQLKQGLARGLETGIGFAKEQLQRTVIPGVSPEVSQDVFRAGPLSTLGKLATGYGVTQFPLSTAGAFAVRKGLETPIGRQALEKTQQLTSLLPKQLPFEPTMRAIQTSGELARQLPPEQYAEIPKTAAESAAFMGLSRFDRPLSQLAEKLPQPMGKGYKLQRAEQLAADAEDIKQGIGKQIGQELNTLTPTGTATKGSLYVDNNIDNDIKRLLPPKITEKLKDPIYDVKWIGGKIEKTTNNIHRFRQALADQMTGKDWFEATSKLKENVGRMFMVSGDYMKKTIPELSPLFDEYSGYIKNVYEPATKVLYRGETVVERPVRAAIRKGAEESTQQAVEALGGMSKTSERALRDLQKYAGRVATRRTTGKAMGTVGRGLLLGAGIAPPLGGLAYLAKRIMGK